MIHICNKTFVVFDLDDTLYRENEYHESGLQAVSDLVLKIYGENPIRLLLDWKKAGVQDLLGRLCEELSLPLVVKESLLWEYRIHFPKISLRSGARQVLEQIGNHALGIAILTDGRSVTQRLKLQALGLDALPVFISEEWGDVKPSERRFVEISDQYPAAQYVYVGDNPIKDFVAPNRLGWTTVGLLDSGSNIHRQDIKELSDEYLPSLWVKTLEELLSSIC